MPTVRTCAYCEVFDAHPRICPATGEICEWCCVRCCASQCVQLVAVTRYPAAERVAMNLEVLGGEDVDGALARWLSAFEVASTRRPEVAMSRAARTVLEHRLGRGGSA